MTTRRAFTVFAAVASLAVSGCGSNDPEPRLGQPSTSAATSTAELQSRPLSRAEFVERAESICADVAKKAPKFPGKRDKNGGFQTTAKYVIPYLEKIDDLSKESLRRLEKLTPPPQQRSRVRNLLRAQRARILNLETAMVAASSGNGAAFTRAFQRDQRTTGPRYIRAAIALGLKNCR